MADTFYKNFFQHLGQGDINLSSDPISLVLVDTNGGTPYTPNFTDGGDDALDDIPAGARLVTLALSTITFVNRVLDAADFAGTFTDPGGGDTGEAIVLYINSGVEGTSYLIAYIDSITELPLTLDGTNDTLTFDVSGILRLGPA
jgi:hypothetical protein